MKPLLECSSHYEVPGIPCAWYGSSQLGTRGMNLRTRSYRRNKELLFDLCRTSLSARRRRGTDNAAVAVDVYADVSEYPGLRDFHGLIDVSRSHTTDLLVHMGTSHRTFEVGLRTQSPKSDTLVMTLPPTGRYELFTPVLVHGSD